MSDFKPSDFDHQIFYLSDIFNAFKRALSFFDWHGSGLKA